MKILFVDLEYDYGIKARGINTIGQLGFKKSLEKLGHEVITFYYDFYLDGKLDQLQSDLKKKADDIKPELIFFILFRDQFSIETLEYLKAKYNTINWFGDDTWRFDSFTKKFANHFTYCVTTDKFSILKYKRLGVENIIRAQWAAIDDEMKLGPMPYKYDVSFVGAKNPFRSYFISFLKKKGIHVECFGNGWPNGMLSNKEMIQLFASSKINLNLSNSASFDMRYLLAHPKNILHTFHSKKHGSQTKARNFEINYFYGFQLTEYVPTLEEYYDIGKEVACYNTPEDALLLINYFLENNEEREHIRDNGTRKARLAYTYTSWLKKILNEINK